MTRLVSQEKAPLIGLTLDHVDPNEEAGGGGYSKYPWYAIRHRYCEAVASAGGVPLAIPYHTKYIGMYAGNLDALIITGGGCDVDPKLYGEQERHHTVTIKPNRTQFEMALSLKMLQLNKPVLGICGGMQVLNVLHGGTLYQDIPSEVISNTNHKQTQDRFLPQHTVDIKPGTLLFALSNNTSTISVNSVHHQAVKKVAISFEVNATAPDGIIEGIESSQYKFCLGVQWHPEFHVSKTDEGIFHGLVQACRS